MIYQQLEEIVQTGQEQKLQPLYIRSQLKEHLQLYLLSFIYTSKPYKDNFIFTGGTCLRHFYGLERLSEDIDFDVLKKVDIDQLQFEVKKFFQKKYLLNNISVSIKQRGKQLLLKFPVLKKLGLASESESDLLYVKLDLSPIFPEHYDVITESKSNIGLNFVAKHYDLPTLMANKIYAIFERKILKGKKNRPTIKGRDFFDLLWFVKRGTKLNLKRFGALTGNPQVQLAEIEQSLDEKVNTLHNKFLNDFELDLLPFMSDPGFVKSYIKNYREEYQRNKANSFATTINLVVRCQNCKQQFSSGITMSEQSYNSVSLIDNVHTCPFCQYKNMLNKGDYIVQGV